MFGFLKPVVHEASSPLTDTATAEAFWRVLPREDPIAAQKAVCDALAEPVARGGLNSDRLRALLMLDQRLRPLLDVLLAHDTAGNVEAPAQETQPRQAAFDLCFSFGRAYGQLLRPLCDQSGHQDWRKKYESHMLLRLLQHRQTELLLRPFVDERSTRFAWKEAHAVYRFAQSRGSLREEVPVNRNGSPIAADTTLEREYVHLLLQEFVNGGQFPPHDAFWISQAIHRWCRGMTLESTAGRTAENQFIVDPHGEVGLVRSVGETTSTSLRLDMGSVVFSIRKEVVSLREAPDRPVERGLLGRARKLALLNKLDAFCAPERPAIARRGEREPTAVAVEVLVGLSPILRMLRKGPDQALATARPLAASEGLTITGLGGLAEDSTGTYANGANTVMQAPTGAGNGGPAPMTMVDCSDSGCRLHGPTLTPNPALPGALIAFREDAASPWKLAIVRRVKKRLAGKRIEIGVEYVGKAPRWVVVVPDSSPRPGQSPDSKPPRFAALYLPESTEHPVLPIKTLILPARGISPEGRLSVRSRSSVHAIQLKEPLEEQADFIWSPFEILERWLKDAPQSGDSSPQETASRSPALSTSA